MKKLTVLAITGLLSVTANATNWVDCGYNPQQAQSQSIDTDSISIDEKYRTAFVRTIYGSHQNTFGTSEPTNKNIVLYKYDCDGNPKKQKILSAAFYNDDKPIDEIIGSFDWRITYPESLSASAANFVCSY